MSLRNPTGGPRPMNPPDAFSYRQQAQQPHQGQPQSQGQGNPPPPRPAPQPAHAQQQQQQQGQQQPQQQQQGQQQGSFVKPPPLSLEQSKQVARTHYSALKGWLSREGALASGTTRTNAREKLTRLTRQQFQELSTDVYDELMRRIGDSPEQQGQQPFLAVRPDFHPKRNQARQKLATLPLLRFRDLASDVYFELDRRYPEFGEEDDNANGQGYTSPPPVGTASSPHSRSGSLASSQHHGLASPPLSTHVPPSNLNSRRAPTPTSASHPTSPPLASSAAIPTGNDVVVPVKSTMVVEGDDDDAASPQSRSGGGASDERSPPPSVDDLRPQSADQGGMRSPGLSGRSGSSAGAFGAFGAGPGGAERAEELVSPPTSARLLDAHQQQNHHQNRASEVSSAGTGTSSRFFGGYAGSAGMGPASEAGQGAGGNGRRSWEHDAADKVRSEYEYKLAMLQNRVAELEREQREHLDGAGASERGLREQWDQERRRWEQRHEEQSSQLRSLQREHDNLRASSTSRGLASPPAGGDAHLHTRLHEAEELASELRGEVSSLVDEIRQVSERADELQREVEREKGEREKSEKEAREWKERWQAVKLELRNVKATSQLFTSAISVDSDWLPASSDGLINDTSVGAFQTSIDDLLQAARSKEPSSVLPAFRVVVVACGKIDTDVQAIPPSRLASLPFSEQELVNSLKGKINATLSNLLTASKNHATSFGVSPVSLLDAAASHLASTIVELVRILKIRRTTGPSGGRGGSRSSLDPSAAFGSFRNGSLHGHDPMPSLPEDLDSFGADESDSHRGQSDEPYGLSITVPSRDQTPKSPMPPALPEKEAKRDSASTSRTSVATAADDANKASNKSSGYLSGGMSSLLGAGGSVKHAFEALGISGGSDRGAGKRGSVDTVSERDRASVSESTHQQQQQPAYQYQPYGQQQQQQHQRNESTDPYGGESYDSGYSRAGPARSDSYDSHAQQQQQQQQHSYGGYGQQQPQYGSGAPFEYGAEHQADGQPQQQPHYGHDQGGYGDQHHEHDHGQDEQHTGAPYGVASPGMRGQERNPEELRAYIENQTEAIVHSIQSLLSAIRSGAQSSELNDNLTQIITIVSSIVAISQEALPAEARGEGDAILQDLTTHCDKLSEMQSHDAGAFGKQTKQAMAAASFGVAKQLKALNALLSSGAGDE
ncbi:uncharacterized protein JCM10292_004496 [Rhodotorula paludigena]|uniref:uncharacterized protein n=1 Tax=Rhodotorula paludigena TaxID=86838 RepID=UPI00317FAA65